MDNHTKSQKSEIQPTLTSLQFHYYPFLVKLDRCAESCNTINDSSNKVCVPNKTEHLNLNVINMITGINESKTLTKQISCEHHIYEKGYV